MAEACSPGEEEVVVPAQSWNRRGRPGSMEAAAEERRWLSALVVEGRRWLLAVVGEELGLSARRECWSSPVWCTWSRWLEPSMSSVESSTASRKWLAASK